MIDWHELLPHEIAVQQVAWDRHALVGRMQAVGMTCREIGRRLGLSATRVSQMGLKFKRDVRLRLLSPVERYQRLPGGDVVALADKIVYHVVRQPQGYMKRVRRPGVWPTKFFKQTVGRVGYRSTWWETYGRHRDW